MAGSVGAFPSRRRVLIGAGGAAAAWSLGCVGLTGSVHALPPDLADLDNPPVLDPKGRRREATGRVRELPPGFTRLPGTQDGLDRESILYVPPDAGPDRKVPLLLAIHGNGQTSESMFREFKLGWVVHDRSWVGLFPETDVFSPTDPCPDMADLRYLSALIDRAVAELPVDPARVWVCGFSGGAMKSYRLAAHRSERIAAIATMAGTIGHDLPRMASQWDPEVTGAGPLSILHVHGDRDTTVPVGGGPVVEYPEVKRLPALEGLAHWVRATRAVDLPGATAPSACPERARVQGWTTADGRPIRAVLDPQLGHVWPDYMNAAVVEFLTSAPPR